MNRKKDKSSGVYKYLELSGVLDTGTSEDIERKRVEYWNIIKRKYKQEKRKTETEFKIYFTDTELQSINRASKFHRMSRTKYIKQATLAYANQKFLVPDQAAVNHITQLLSLNYSILQELTEKVPFNLANELLRQMAGMEYQVLNALTAPPLKKSNPWL